MLASEKLEQANSSAGVALLLSHRLARVANQVYADAVLRGHVVHVTLSLPGLATLHLLGVYMPANCSALASRVRHYITSVCNSAATAKEHVHVSGDFNSALLPGDRASTFTAFDKSWQMAAEAAKLVTLPSGAEGRENTFKKPSRIDDALLSEALLLAFSASKVLRDFPTASDHFPLAYNLDLEQLGACLPSLTDPCLSPREPTFRLPFIRTQLHDYQTEASKNLDFQTNALHSEILAMESNITIDENDIANARSKLATVDESLNALLLAFLDQARNTCSMNNPSDPVRSNGPCLPRKLHVAWLKHMTRAAFLRDAIIACATVKDPREDVATQAPDLKAKTD